MRCPWTGALLSLSLPVFAGRMMARFRRMEDLVDRPESYSMLPCKRLFPKAGRSVKSANIRCLRPGVDGKIGRTRVILSAHLDTKSQNMPIVVRIAFAILFALGMYLLPVMYFIVALFSGGIAGSVAGVLFWLALVSASALLTLRVSDKSPGALDNAASCAVVMEIVNALKQDGGYENIDVEAVITGAEELGLAGSAAFVRRHKERIADGRTIVINLDGLGGSDRFVMTSETGLFTKHRVDFADLQEMVVQSASETGLRLKVLTRNIGGEADHFAFAINKIPAVTIGAFGKSTLAIHTAKDSADNLDPASFEASGRLLTALLNRIDSSM